MDGLSDGRARKEAFVTGLEGTWLIEVQASCALPVILLLIRQCPAIRCLSRRSAVGGWVLDALLLVMPLIGALMGVGSGPVAWAAAGTGVAAVLTLGGGAGPEGGKKTQAPKPGDTAACLRAGLAAYRGSLMLTTCVCILAVDFNAFPRRFAKVETYGTGLMDAGVGSFVAASALVRGVQGPPSARRPGALGREARRIGGLLLLGLVRVVATKGIDYQLHAAEYGTHWNFFFTLAALRLAMLSLEAPGMLRHGWKAPGALGLVILAGHQAVLQGAGLIEVLHSDIRGPDLLSQNKEGLGSLPGYCALHLLALSLGSAAGSWAGHRQRLPPLSSATAALASIALLALPVPNSSGAIGQGISRRACNAPYIIWVLVLNAQALASFALAALAAGVPALLVAISDAQLPVFLVANVLTGAVNFAVDTLATPPAAARSIVAAYMLALCALSMLRQTPFVSYRALH